ncbi:MAG: hypothetical protein ACI87N_000566 [Flavobacteriales bacterium]
MIKQLRFNKTHYGKNTEPDALHYHLLPSEVLINTNSIDQNKEKNIELKWDTETKLIKLELKQKDSPSGQMGDIKSISEYWEK